MGVPYGNAQDAGGAIMCQHGEDECFGNRLHICAKEKFGGNKDGLYKWITCHESKLRMGLKAIDQASYAECGFDAGALTACANDFPQIIEKLRAAGAETAQGQIQQAPWVVFTDQSTQNVQGAFLPRTCARIAQQNLPPPACCNGVAPMRRLLV